MKKEKHYFCVRLPEESSLDLRFYGVIRGKLLQTQTCSGKKAANNVIYHYGGENRALISTCLHKSYGDLSKFTMDLDEASGASYQYDFWKKDVPIRSLDAKGLSGKIKDKLGVRVVNGEEDCFTVANKYINYRLNNPLNQ